MGGKTGNKQGDKPGAGSAVMTFTVAGCGEFHGIRGPPGGHGA